MCGITGFWRIPKGQDDGANELIRTMASTLAHRGPDAEGVWVDSVQGLALGHRRLAIRDLSVAGDQPMFSSDGRYVIVFNGEIYNAEELQNGLERLGPLPLRGTSDTEVFLEAIVRLGLRETLRQSVGMFALALWDRCELELTLVRDRFGEKPLYFAEIGKEIAFGSELKALKPYPQISSQPNAESIRLYLRYGYVPPPLTIIDGIQKLGPGEGLSLRRDRGRLEKSLWRYWCPEEDLYYEGRNTKQYSSLSQAADDAEAFLERAVRRQLVSDVPLGAFLSGGIDSSLIVALMLKVGDSRPKTFTIGFDDSRFDEAPYARAIAQHLGTDHVEEYVGNRQLFDIIPQLPYIYDEPIGDSSCIPTVLVSGIAKKHVKVVLSGDGGDELFAGYNHYRWGPWVSEAIRSIPTCMRGAAKRGLIKSGQTLRKRRLVRLGESIGALPSTDPLMLLNANIPDLSDLVSYGGQEKQWYAEPRVALSLAERIMKFDIQGHLPGDILVKVDRASMHFGLECRAPFLDHGVAEFACSLPSKHRGNYAEGKLVLKEVLSRLIPRELFLRPKAGFGLPLGVWLRADLKDMAEKYLIHFPTRYEEWLMRTGVVKLWHEHQTGTVDRQRELWTLISLMMWMEAEDL